MPELPEVETIKRQIEPLIIGKIISSIAFNRHNIRNILPHDKINLCNNAKIISVKRVAKYLIMELSNGYSLIIHLGMTGRLIIKDLEYLNAKHDHVRIELEDSSIIFNDARRFGVFDIIPQNEFPNSKYFINQGLEPLTSNFNASYLFDKLKKKTMPIKAAIMDNSIVVGVGNIYACESLFMAKTNPFLKANLLNHKQLGKLVIAIKTVLLNAIDAGGSTIKDYKTPDGSSGYFQTKFSVYGKSNCLDCSGAIQKHLIAGRATYFCSLCQKI